jgi:hypothetical protein
VNIIGPTSGAAYRLGEPIVVTVQASDPDGTLAEVGVYEGGALLQQLAAGQSEWTWTDAGAGLHRLTARATDNEGGQSESVAVEVAVYAAPAELPVVGLGLWLDAGTGVEVGANDQVLVWTDRSVYGNRLLEQDAVKRPRLVAQGPNQRSVVAFDGVDDILTNRVDGRRLIGGNAGTIYVVQRQAATHPANTTFTWQAPNYLNRVNLHLGFSGRLYFDFGDTAGGRISAVQPIWWGDSYHVIEAYRSGGSGSLWAAGETLVQANFGDTLDNALTGDLIVGGTPGAYLQGEVAEVLVYSRALDESERNAVRGYLGRKYDLPFGPNLPPTVAVGAPAAGSKHRKDSVVVLKATAADPEGGAVTVKFYAGPDAEHLSLVGQDDQSPYEVEWRPGQVGMQVLRAVGVDKRGGEGQSELVTVEVLPPNQAPVVVIKSPVGGWGCRVGEDILVEAEVTDADGQVVWVGVYDGETQLARWEAGPYTWTWSGADAGLHLLLVKATDNEGGLGEATVEVGVNVITEPIPVAGLRLWLDAEQGVQAGQDGSVSAWTNRSLYGRTFVQDLLTKRPALVKNVLQGKSVLRFDGIDDALVGRVEGPKLFAPTAGTVYIVQRQVAAKARNTTFTWQAPNYANWVNIHLTYDDKLVFDFGDGGGGLGRIDVGQPAWWDQEYQVVELAREDATGTIWAGGEELVRKDFRDTLDNGPTGDLIIGGATGAFLQGDIAEILIYSRGLPPQERTVVRDYLGTKYGLLVRSNQPPTVAVQATPTGPRFRVASTVKLTAEASDPEGQMIRVKFYAAMGADPYGLLGETAAAPYELATWKPNKEGDWKVKAVATDSRGLSTESEVITVKVLPANQSPVVALASPTAGSAYLLGEPVLLEATATDADGSVARLAFYDRTNLIVELTTAPFRWEWTNAEVGVHQVFARATDDESSSADTSAIETPVYSGTGQLPIVGLRLWLEAGWGITADETKAVRDWQDRSPYGNLVSQLELGKRPQLAADAINNRPAVAFDGTDDSLAGRAEGSKLLSPTAATVYVVQKQLAGKARNTTFTWQGPNYLNWLNLNLAYDNKLYFDYGDVTSGGGRLSGGRPPGWEDAWHLLEASRNGNAGVLWIDGTNWMQGQFTNVLATARVGDLIIGGSGAATLKGAIGEIIVYNRALADWERMAVQDYLGKKYGLYVPPNQNPTVALTEPASGFTVRTTKPVRWAATGADSDGVVVLVSFYASRSGGSWEAVGQDAKAPFELLWNAGEPGDYQLKAVATDNRGGQSESGVVDIKVLPPNRAPVVSLLTPVDGSTYRLGDSIVVEAEASDSDGSVVKVRFFDGASLLGEVSAQPYTFTWTNAAAGLHQLMARATDNEDAQTNSTSIEVAVYGVTGDLPVAGLGLWLDAGQGTETDTNGLVVAWLDRGPYGHRVAQAEQDARPRLVGQELNGQPVVRFDGAGDALSGEAEGRRLFGTNAGTVYLVQRQAAAKSLNTSFTWQAPNIANWVNANLTANDKLTFDYGDGTAGGRLTADQPKWWDDLFHVVELMRDGETGTVWASGEELLRGQFSGALRNRSVGEVLVGGAGGATLSGEIAEIMVYSRALSAQERAKTRAYLGGKYGLPITSNIPPTITITVPTEGATVEVGTPTEIKTTVNDTDGQVVAVEFLVNGGSIGAVTAAPFKMSWLPTAAGNYRLEAVARDNRRASTTSSVVNVSALILNKMPVVQLVEPAADTNLPAPAQITLKATASDEDGIVVKVEFYAGANLLKTVTSKPFTMNWTGILVGTYEVTAKAHDDKGGAGVSASRRVRVLPSIRSPERLPSGRFVFTFYGEPNRAYTVEASEDLVNWKFLRTLQSPDGISDFTDVEATTKLRRFYRIKAQ